MRCGPYLSGSRPVEGVGCSEIHFSRVELFCVWDNALTAKNEFLNTRPRLTLCLTDTPYLSGSRPNSLLSRPICPAWSISC